MDIEWFATGEDKQVAYFDNLESVLDDNTFTGVMMKHPMLLPVAKRNEKYSTLKRVLLSCGLNLIQLPLDIYQCFQRSDVPVDCVSPEAVIQFFKSYCDEKPKCSLGVLPIDVASTPFGSVKSLMTVFEYCCIDKDVFLGNLDGLPLLLCEDNQVRIFSNSNQVYLSQHKDILPGLSSMFVHEVLVNTIFKEMDVKMKSIFLEFDIEAFAGLLGNELKEYAYKTDTKHVLWAGGNQEMPTEMWISQVWNFLDDVFEREMCHANKSDDFILLKETLLKPLQSWCLIPCNSLCKRYDMSSKQIYSGGEDRVERFLVSIGMASTVIDYTNASIMSYPIRECLRKLGIPELDKKVLKRSKVSNVGLEPTKIQSVGIVNHLVATLEKPADVLRCLKYAENNIWKAEYIQPEDCFIILKYFNDSIDAWKYDESARQNLLGLPLYFTFDGSVTRIEQRKVYVLPPEIPQTNMDTLQKTKGLLFLKFNPALSHLYETLGCYFLTGTEVYTELVFQNFEQFSNEARIIHLQFLKEVKLPQLVGREREAFVQELRALDCLEDLDGCLQPVSNFHDPHHPVFKIILEGNRSAFPPHPFNEFKWLAFLKLIGLTHEVSEESFLEFAQRVASEAEFGANENTFNKARALVNYLFSSKELLTGNLLSELKGVKFIPAAQPSKSVIKISPPFKRDGEKSPDMSQCYISFDEGISESHEELVWTSSYLLPDWANPLKINLQDLGIGANGSNGTTEHLVKEIAGKLNIQMDPSIDLVIEHTKNVCVDEAHNQQEQDDIQAYMKMNVMKRVYRFLQGKCQESDLARSRLRDTRFVSVDLGQTFVKPKQVVINLYEEDQIVPYLFKVPTELGEFKNLFLHLGATLNATADQYALVLESIYNATVGAKLHPNEMRAAFKAVNELFSALEKHPDDAMFTETLFLPSASGRLIQSTELVFNDDPSYTDRIRSFDKPFLVDLAECKLKARTYEDVVKLLPKHLRPLMLTSLVKEVLEVECKGLGYDFGVTEKLKHQLNSKAFSNGVVRLIRHEHRRSGHKVKESVIDKIQNDLKMINVMAMDRVVTHLTYQGERIQGSASEADCFVDKVMLTTDENDSCWNIYLTNSVSMNEELLVSVADVVNKIVKGLLANSVHYLQPIMSCQPHSISRVLDRLKIRPDHSNDVKTPTLPTAGSFIPIEDHHLLREDFVQFESGEYVGFELDDDDSGQQTVIYAIILDKLLEETTDEHGVSVLTQKYKVCVGEDHKSTIAAATDLYKFHRVERLVSRGTESENSFHFPQTPGGSHSSPRYRPSFYEQSSIFEPSAPLNMEDVFDDTISSTPKPRKKMFEKGQSSPSPTKPASVPNPASVPIEESEEEYENQDQDFVQSFGRFKFKPRQKIKRDRKKRQRYEEASQPYVYKEDKCDVNENGFKSGQEFIYNSEDQPTVQDTDVDTEFQEHDTRDGQTHQLTEEDSFQQYEGVSTDQPNPDIHERELTTHSDEQSEAIRILNEISDTLEEAWGLSEGQRKKIIKRLLLKWHPDKNIGNENFSTAVTQHIHSEIERLELGLPRPGIAEEFAANYQFDVRNPFSGSTSFQKNFYNAYQTFYEQMNQRAKEHREQRERYKDNLSREYSSNQFDFDVPPSFSSSNPQPAQAKRFLKQAQEDLRAADNDYDVGKPAFEWVCFKSHQAAEKALKAAQFSVDAVTSFSHDLASLAATIEDMELRRLSLKLQRIVGNSNKLYNPDPIDFVIIPHEEYSKEMACDAIMCAADILERVKEFVEIREKEAV